MLAPQRPNDNFQNDFSSKKLTDSLWPVKTTVPHPCEFQLVIVRWKFVVCSPTISIHPPKASTEGHMVINILSPDFSSFNHFQF